MDTNTDPTTGQPALTPTIHIDPTWSPDLRRLAVTQGLTTAGVLTNKADLADVSSLEVTDENRRPLFEQALAVLVAAEIAAANAGDPIPTSVTLSIGADAPKAVKTSVVVQRGAVKTCFALFTTGHPVAKSIRRLFRRVGSPKPREVRGG